MNYRGSARLDEAAATLKDEAVAVESCFTFDVSGKKHLLWYLRAKSIKRVFGIAAQSTHPIDNHHEMHQAMTATVIMAKPLMDIPRHSSCPRRSRAYLQEA